MMVVSCELLLLEAVLGVGVRVEEGEGVGEEETGEG